MSRKSVSNRKLQEYDIRVRLFEHNALNLRRILIASGDGRCVTAEIVRVIRVRAKPQRKSAEEKMKPSTGSTAVLKAHGDI
jgi:hypothetical protein